MCELQSWLMQGAVFACHRALFWLVINRYRIRMCESRRRMNNEISDNNQKIVLKLRVMSATIELVKKLASDATVYKIIMQ